MFPILSVILFLPLATGLLLLIIPRENVKTVQRVGVIFALAAFALSVVVWVLVAQANSGGGQLPVEDYEWIPAFSVRYHLEADGLGAPLISLAALVIALALFYSERTVAMRVKEYFFLFLLLETCVFGVFLARDLVLFYVFWVLGLLPMVLLISVWGGQGRERAAVKFFLYNLLASVAMLLVILVVFAQVETFDMQEAAQKRPYGADEYFVNACIALGGLFFAFAVRLPSFPFHTWLTDAQSESPTAVSAVLASVILSTGGYGLMRVALPLFPDQFYYLTVEMPVFPILAVTSIVYGALVCLAQWDLKRLISFMSVVQMGFVTLGVCAASMGYAILKVSPTLVEDQSSVGYALRGLWALLEELPAPPKYEATLNAAVSGLGGAAMQMFAHGVVIAALFFLAGILHQRTRTYDLKAFGGFSKRIPHYYGLVLVAGFAALGLPGLIGFWGEFFVFKSTMGLVPIFAFIGMLGVVFSAGYTLWKIVQHIFLGELDEERWGQLPDMVWWETLAVWPLVVVIVVFGLYPTLLLDMFNTALTLLLNGLL
ncbi:MAG: NADH-quinone oxidoreductase subunit M [Anaerolineae bacterium]|nr:NADH-quinone oxidoreductase subunit M [Anaerolineae bacterium]